jgi:excisionase family DNA binding protein
MVRLNSTTHDWLTVSQSAARLKTTRQNIHDAINRGRLKATTVGAILLIDRAALDAYGKSRKRTGRPPTRNKKQQNP